MDTIRSRCVEVRLHALGDDALAQMLSEEGVERAVAQRAAAAANGNLRRAQVLARDEGLAERVARWRSVPDRLVGTPASAANVAMEISVSLDDALEPLARLHEEEMTQRVSDAREMGYRALGNRKESEAQFKREQRRFRLDELRFGLSALTNVYRDRMVDDLAASAAGDARSDFRVGGALRALDAIAEANRRLSTTVDETLLLHDLMLSLMEY
jgi:DNA polymerase III delta prime subunit